MEEKTKAMGPLSLRAKSPEPGGAVQNEPIPARFQNAWDDGHAVGPMDANFYSGAFYPADSAVLETTW